jgi:hypothetical protein
MTNQTFKLKMVICNKKKYENYVQVATIYQTAVIAKSVWRWATGWTIGILGFDSRRVRGFFFVTTASRPALGPTPPPIHWVPGALSLGVKRAVHEADHSPTSSAEVKE